MYVKICSILLSKCIPVSSTKSIYVIYQSLKNSIIDGADKIENVCNIDIVIKDIFKKKKENKQFIKTKQRWC